jgi:hypothetical protein
VTMDNLCVASVCCVIPNQARYLLRCANFSKEPKNGSVLGTFLYLFVDFLPMYPFPPTDPRLLRHTMRHGAVLAPHWRAVFHPPICGRGPQRVRRLSPPIGGLWLGVGASAIGRGRYMRRRGCIVRGIQCRPGMARHVWGGGFAVKRCASSVSGARERFDSQLPQA